MSKRPDIVAEEIRQLLSQALLFDIRDPRLEGVTLTGVRVSPDLQYADLRFTIGEDDPDIARVLQAFERARGFFKRLLAKNLRLRRIPDLRFHFDDRVEAERRINQILQGLHIPDPEPDDDDES
jgi:ribosome-binding factor A